MNSKMLYTYNLYRSCSCERNQHGVLDRSIAVPPGAEPMVSYTITMFDLQQEMSQYTSPKLVYKYQ